MKLAFQLAYRNLIGAGLRTWLNVSVLSFALLMILFFNGLLDGWNQQARHDTIEWEIGHGQLLNENYDPFDPFTLQDGHGKFPEKVDNLAPILIQQASIYPEGRMISIALKGIETEQSAVAIPTAALKESSASIPAVIGKRMAESTKLKKGDEVLLRWRDKNGTFDASNIQIVEVFDCNVGMVDAGQIWIPLDKLWEMTGFENEATMFIAEKEYAADPVTGWKYLSQEELLGDINEIIAMKKVSGSITYLLLLAIALLAIFDTQVLSIFRRQKEIGTYIALGMTRRQVVGLFTVEGSMYSFLAIIVGAIIGTPLFYWINKTGMEMNAAQQDIGVSIADRIHPVFGLQLILGTMVLIIIAATIVSYLPAGKISKMDPVAALKGKLQ